jgi:predicted dehydrogenase
LSDARPRVALVGCGKRGRSHLAVLGALRDRLDLVAVCDPDAKARSEAVALAGEPARAVARVEEVAAAGVALAVVSLKGHVQPAACAALLERGVSVLAEVPPAFSGIEAQRMLDAAARGGAFAAAAENYVCTPLELLKQQAIAAGVFGEIQRAEVFGSINHKGHEIAVARSYVGFGCDPVRVSARADGSSRRTLEGIAVPSVMAGTVELEGGRCIDLTLSGWGDEGPKIPIVGLRNDFQGTLGGYSDGCFHTAAQRKDAGWREIPWRAETETLAGSEVLRSLVLESDSPVVWTNPFADRVFADPAVYSSMLYIEDLPQAWEIAIAVRVIDALDAVAAGREPGYPVARAITDVRIRLAMLESAKRGGEWVPWQSDPFPLEHDLLRQATWRRLRDLRKRVRLRQRLRA